MKPYDLHNHSIVSKDGKTPARELIDMAVARGMKGLGICDHDEFPDDGLYAYARSKGLRLALGTEFSCDHAHIIGYNMDVRGQDRIFLDDRFAKLRKDYVEVTHHMISQLQKHGIDITYEQVQEAYDKENVQKLFVFKYLAEKRKMYPSWSEARKDLQHKVPYLNDGATVERLDPVRAIEIIHNAGGYAIWAHPFITREDKRAEYFELLPKHGIDAIEANYAYRQNGYKGDETNERLERTVRQILNEKGIPASGGSDSHYPLKTYSDLSPITPGDFGITEGEFQAVRQMFR